MVPKIIHCCWFGGPKTKLALKCRASWERFAPDWEIREWGENEVERLAQLPGYGFFKAAIARRKWSAASDWVRMAALYEYGGLYLDFDHELLSSLDDLMDEEWVASEFTISGGTEPAAGAGLALKAGSGIAGYMLGEYAKLPIEHIDEMMPWIVGRMEEAFAQYGRIRVLPPEVMSPVDTRGVCHRVEGTRGIHHYAMSWSSPRRKFARWLSWHGMREVVDLLLKARRWK